MANIKTTLLNLIRSDRPFSARVIHDFSPIYTHVLNRGGLGVKIQVTFFKIEQMSDVGGYCLIDI